MAVYAAHLTRTLHGTPSIFQVTAQDSLGSTVKPALAKLTEYLATLYPNKLGWCVKWYDELYLLFDCCLQYYYLKHYAASFSESFYGLLRVPTTINSEFNSGQRLPDFLEKGSLGLLVLVPYLRDKLEKIIDKWREDEEDGKLGKTRSDRARRAAVRFYSVLHFVCALSQIVQLARYLRGGATSHAPALALLGIRLQNAPPVQDQYQHTWTDLFRSIFTGNIGSMVVTFPMVGGTMLRLVEYGAFLVQFVRWWESSGGTAAATLPTPPPPITEQAKRRGWTNRCPLCLQPWRTPTVLPVSGYVFCYVCISRHLRTHRTCPATRLPAVEADLVRLYID